MEIDKRVKAVYQRYKRGGSEGEKKVAEKMLHTIAYKLEVSFEKLLEILGEVEMSSITLVYPRMLTLVMNHIYTTWCKTQY